MLGNCCNRCGKSVTSYRIVEYQGRTNAYCEPCFEATEYFARKYGKAKQEQLARERAERIENSQFLKWFTAT
jgi:hypothetical protein